jgi:HK97 family phage major capsid protein
MDRRQALAQLQKATIDTTMAASALLSPERSRQFVQQVRDQGNLLQAIRVERRTSPSGVIDKMSVGARLIRRATENSDDGYRAGVGFAQVPYATVKMRLPWEITEDAIQENIEGEGLDADVVNAMTQQFAYDLEDLSINGDIADASADAPFLTINDGILKQIATAPIAARNIDGSAINGGAISKDHFFEGVYALPNKYRNQGGLEWIMSPNRAISWWEALTERAGAAGDALLGSRDSNSAVRGPLNYPIREVPAMPDTTILLANPKNFVNVITWDIRRRKVTGETDAELAVKDKRLYIFFLKSDTIIEERDAVVRIHSLDPIA